MVCRCRKVSTFVLFASKMTQWISFLYLYFFVSAHRGMLHLVSVESYYVLETNLG